MEQVGQVEWVEETAGSRGWSVCGRWIKVRRQGCCGGWEVVEGSGGKEEGERIAVDGCVLE